jgi:hypothetical protein
MQSEAVAIFAVDITFMQSEAVAIFAVDITFMQSEAMAISAIKNAVLMVKQCCFPQSLACKPVSEGQVASSSGG